MKKRIIFAVHCVVIVSMRLISEVSNQVYVHRTKGNNKKIKRQANQVPSTQSNELRLRPGRPELPASSAHLDLSPSWTAAKESRTPKNPLSQKPTNRSQAIRRQQEELPLRRCGTAARSRNPAPVPAVGIAVSSPWIWASRCTHPSVWLQKRVG